MKTGHFNAFDGQELFYREWESNHPNGNIIIVLHRGHEHSERLSGLAEPLTAQGYRVFSYDNRGHGHSQVEATREFMTLVRDLDAFVHFVCQQAQCQQQAIFIVANSVAGVVASTWVHDFAPNIAGMALLAPAFRIKLYVPLAKPLLDLVLRFKPDLNITSYVKAQFLTHDPLQQQQYNTDALITPLIPARQLTTLLDTAKRVVDDAHLIVTPTLVMSATHDYVVDSAVQQRFYAMLSSPLKQWVTLQGFYHGVLYEKGADTQVIPPLLAFVVRCFAHTPPPQQETLRVLTQHECNTLEAGLMPLHRRINYALQRFMLKHVGAVLSKGIQIGQQYGFDSGVTLDHVYRNQAQGVGRIGQYLDRNYLDSIGWRGIRQRKVHSMALLQQTIAQLRERGEPVRIVDIAGGPARYLIEMAQAMPDITIQVRDYQEQNLTQGRALADSLNLTNIEYVAMDAFDPRSYIDQTFRPTIVVVSGIFELFGDNALVETAIRGIARFIQPQGYVLYTGQPWHPQLEQIAQVLGNHQQQAWVMRRRSQYELDALFSAAGFCKQAQRVDDWGIFTVSLVQADAL